MESRTYIVGFGYERSKTRTDESLNIHQGDRGYTHRGWPQKNGGWGKAGGAGRRETASVPRTHNRQSRHDSKGGRQQNRDKNAVQRQGGAGSAAHRSMHMRLLGVGFWGWGQKRGAWG